MLDLVIRFVEGTQWDSHLIRYQTRCRWSHCEFYDPTTNMTIGSMLDGGVHWRDPDYAHASAYQKLTLQVPETDHFKVKQFWESQLGKPYDWRAIISFGLGSRDWRQEDAWFCSEFVAATLELINKLVLPPDIGVSRITPRDMWVLGAGLVAQRNATWHPAQLAHH